MSEENPLDVSHFREVLLRSAEQFQQGFDVAQDVRIEGHFDRVMISGMGGSALPGNILRTFLHDQASRSGKNDRLEIYQNRFYALPPEAFDNCLNLFCSHSGNTEETIASFQQALDNKLPSIGISSGGKIEELCRINGIPHVKLPMPFDNFQPRTATGHFFGAIFQLLLNMHLVEGGKEDIANGVKFLAAETEKLESRGKELAKKLIGRTPVIFGSTKYKSIAMIWKIKINENAKTPAFWNYFPELNHNEMVGYTLTQGAFSAILLKDPSDESRNQKRYEITAKLLRDKGLTVDIIDMEGSTVFEKMFHTIALGDWMSYYLALAYNIDPTPVDMVEELKRLLK